MLRARDVLENYSFLYRDALDMARLLKAETRSEPDDGLLARLEVSTRVTPTGRRSTSTPSAGSKHSTRPPRGKPEGKPTPSPAPKEEEREPPAAPPVSVPARGDASERILKNLTDTQRRIFEALPLDHAVPIDAITREGFSVGEVMAAMTILEIHGLTVTLPGGLYARK